ncbi:minor tail protein [Mycobacterium phage JacoRen57]|nr:minor tail protein [Mycobacterium phage JacoRen57]
MTDLISDDFVPPRDDWMQRDDYTGELKPIYQPQNPRWPGWQKNTNWEWASQMLTAESTKMVWVGPNLKWWDLAGNLRGRQGVIATNEITGVGLAPWDHKFSEGPYIAGAQLERTDIRKRIITFGAILNPNMNRMDKRKYNSSFKYRFIEQQWWASFSREKFGYLGFFTRSTGWRWIKCILSSDSSSGNHSLDPVAHGNNAARYDMSLVAVDPYFYKNPFYKTWKNSPDLIAKGKDGFGQGTITLANRGTVVSNPLYLVTAPGQAKIGDGPDRMILMPKTSTADKYYMVDTNENMKTVTGAVDPVDNPFYRFIRQAGLVNFFLHDLAAQGLPLWRRWDDPMEFDYAAEPQSAITAKVAHDYPDGEITMILPQRFEKAW